MTGSATPLAESMDAREVGILAGGASVTFVGALTSAGLQYGVGILVSRLAGPEITGAYFVSLVCVQLASTVARVGLSDALLRFVPPATIGGERGDDWRFVKTSLALGLLGALLLTGLGAGTLPALEHLLKLGDQLISYLSVFFWTLPLHVVFILLLIASQARQRIPQVVLVRDVLQPLLLLVFTAVLVTRLGPRTGLAGGYASSLLIGILLAMAIRPSPLVGAMSVAGWAPLRPLLIFSLPVMVSDLSSYLFRWIDTFTVTYFLDLTQVGIYSAAVRTSLVIGLIVLAANAIYATMASGFYHSNQHGKLSAALGVSVRWCLLLALPLGITFVIGGDLLLGLWGPAFRSASTVLSLLVAGQLLSVPMGILAYTLLMCNRQNTEVAITIVVVATVLGLNLLLIPRVGLMGAAGSLVIGNVIGLALRWHRVRRFVTVPLRGLRLHKLLLAALTAFAAGFGVRHALRGFGLLDAGASMVAGVVALGTLALTIGGVFLTAILLLGLEPEDRLVARQLVARFR